MSEDEYIAGEAEPWPVYKLDLCFFTEPQFCSAMVRRRSRRAFELFLFLAHQYLDRFGEPIMPTHEQMCAACGLDSTDGNSRTTISRLLKQLREYYGVIEYEPVRRRRPRIRLARLNSDYDPLSPPHYVYVSEAWSATRRATFHTLGSRAFSAEYMYLIAQYEAALARTKHKRSYWFFPLEKIAETYHISTRFAGTGLRALVEMGAMRVAYGQYGIEPNENEFGRANRYYFEGLGAVYRRNNQLDRLEFVFPDQFPFACELALVLTNGTSVKNVEGICQLISAHGADNVRKVVDSIAQLPPRSMKRRLGYVTALMKAT